MYKIFEINPKEHKEEFKQAKKIYKSSFPQEERKPWFFIRSSLKTSKKTMNSINIMLVITLEENSSKILGFALVHYLKSENSLFGRYIAIASENRDSGVGSYFFSKLKDFLIKYISEINEELPIGLIYEIETYDFPKYDDDRQKLIFARYRFYNRFKQKKLDIPYYLPPLLPWYPKIPMYLMFWPFNDCESLSKRDALQIYRNIYSGHYNIRKRNLNKWLKLLDAENLPEKIRLILLDDSII